MFRSKAEILRDLDPTNPATIQALINFHRQTFGGVLMKDGDDDKEEKDATSTSTDGKAGGKGGDATDDKGRDGDKPLGAAGLKALQAERDARQQLETELKDFKTAQSDQAKKLAEAFGIKSEDAKSSDDVVAALQKQVQDMRHDTLVYRVAADHKITDADDLDLIKGVADETAMRKLAARLGKKSDDDETDDKDKRLGRRLPREDSSQGRGGGDGARPASVAQVMADRAAAREAKKSKT